MIGEPVRITVGFASARGSVHRLVGLARAEVKLEGMTLFGRNVVEVDLAHMARATAEF
jgi:hypothetical protein